MKMLQKLFKPIPSQTVQPTGTFGFFFSARTWTDRGMIHSFTEQNKYVHWPQSFLKCTSRVHVLFMNSIDSLSHRQKKPGTQSQSFCFHVFSLQVFGELLTAWSRSEEPRLHRSGSGTERSRTLCLQSSVWTPPAGGRQQVTQSPEWHHTAQTGFKNLNELKEK